MLRFLAVVEDKRSARVVAELVDRTTLEGTKLAWLDADTLPTIREWVDEHGARPSDAAGAVGDTPPWLNIKQAREKWRGLRRPIAKRAEANAAGSWGPHVSIASRVAVDAGLDAVALVIDADAHPSRAAELEASRRVFDAPSTALALGTAIPEVEAWLIAGYPDIQSKAAQALRASLGFEPWLEPDRLLHGKESASPKNAKRVFDALELKDRTDLLTDLTTLRKRGANCGLTTFLDDVKTHIVPVVDRAKT